MEIRPEAAHERAGVRRVVAAAFGTPDVPVLVDELTRSGSARVSLVAVEDRRLVGHVMLSRSWVDAPDKLVEVLVLSPLSVAPEAQGRGIGVALVRAALAAAREAGCAFVFLEGSPDYYSRLGFEPGSAHGFQRPSERIPGPAFQVAVLAADPAVTGRLVYCDAFWATDCVGLRGSRLAEARARFGD